MNPFKLLNIAAEAAPAEILQAACRAMRERKYSIREISLAQKLLLDPVSNQVQRFINKPEPQTLRQEIKVAPPDKVSGPEPDSADATILEVVKKGYINTGTGRVLRKAEVITVRNS